MKFEINNKIEKSYPLIKIEGSSRQKTLFFDIGEKIVLPGQFFMLNYKLSQKPFSISHYDEKKIGFTIEDRGKITSKMLEAKAGEFFGLTGPLGNVFDIDKYKSFLLIGGGIGTAPLYFLANYLNDTKKKFDVFFGAKTKENLVYAKPLEKICNVNFYTDDGSLGNKGFVTSGLEAVLNKKTYDTVCICGPEIMMKAAISKIKSQTCEIQVCMERYMKCGLGICGSCVLDDIGLRVCEDGPVFSYTLLKKSKEFGKYKRDGHGVIEEF